jgi:hypothetical protein
MRISDPRSGPLTLVGPNRFVSLRECEPIQPAFVDRPSLHTTRSPAIGSHFPFLSFSFFDWKPVALSAYPLASAFCLPCLFVVGAPIHWSDCRAQTSIRTTPLLLALAAFGRHVCRSAGKDFLFFFLKKKKSGGKDDERRAKGAAAFAALRLISEKEGRWYY